MGCTNNAKIMCSGMEGMSVSWEITAIVYCLF